MPTKNSSPLQIPLAPAPLAKIIALLTTCVIALLLITGSTNGTVLADGTATPRPESTHPSPITLNPDAGSAIGPVYEAFLSPQQEGGEESETPNLVPSEFHSTAPSVPRNQRTSRGHAVIEFTNDLSKAYVHLAIKNIKVEDINMLHLHCGRPGQLGPILVDFSLIGNINNYLSDGILTLEVTNEDIVATSGHDHSLVAAFTVGCPIVQTIPNDRVRTVAGMELIARQGELYFNLHTKGQTYFGDIRGQFALVTTPKK